MKRTMFLLVLLMLLIISMFGCTKKDAEPSAAPSSGVNTPSGNDSFEGGGAGGTEDERESVRPDAGPESSDGDPGDGIEKGIGDLMQGAGDAIRDAGDAIQNGARTANESVK